MKMTIRTIKQHIVRQLKTIKDKPGNSFVSLSTITNIQTNPFMSDFVWYIS